MILKSGIIGIGSWYSKSFANALNNINQAELTAATYLGQDEETLKVINDITTEEYAQRYGVKLYRTAEEMIEKESLDMVCVCCDNTLRARYAEIAARAGKDVFIAKPMAASLSDADKIVNAAKTNNVLMSTCSPGRFDVAIREAHRHVEAGEIGEVLTARVLIQHGAFRPNTRLKGTPELGEGQGGPELSLGVYAADLLRWFVRSEVVRVYAEYENLNTSWSPYMDSAKGIVRFKDGKMGSMDIYFSTICPAPLWEVEIVGRKGIIRTQQSIYEGVIWKTDQTIVSFCRRQNDVIEDEMRSWVNSCLDRTAPDLCIEDAREVLEICLAWEKSTARKAPVNLPLGRPGKLDVA